MQMGMGARRVIHANQHQHGIERHRGERVGRHAVHFAVEVDGDDRHPGGEASHRFSKFGRIQAHVVLCGGLHQPEPLLPVSHATPLMYHSIANVAVDF